jgi:hypothetical protein
MTLFCHDDDLRRSVDDLTHHVVLGGCWLSQDGMKRRHNRHFKPRQEFNDISAGFAAKDSILVLEANDVKMRIVQKVGGLNVFVDGLVIDLKAHIDWIVVGPPDEDHG